MDTNIQNNQPLESIQNGGDNPYSEDVNLYPTLRTTILILCVLLAVSIAIFLIYQNGKTIYANGL